MVPAGSRAVLLGTGNHAEGSGIPRVPAVPHCLDDLRRTLVARCGFPAQAVTVVADPGTPTELGIALADQADRVDPGGMLLVYYVGHGLVSPAGELYLATAATDARPNRLAYTALAYAQVRTCLLECAATAVVVILDCCFSGRAVGTLGDPLQAATMLAQVRGGYVLTSAAGDELALPPPGQRHTAFTGQLLALLTEGDPLGPAALTLGHLYRYLTRALPARGFPRPRRQASGGVEDLVLAANPAYQPPDVEPELPLVAEPPDPTDVCPYPGLAAFGPAQASWFFGREELTATLLARLAERMYEPGPQLVAGASGSGKSSLLRAGLIAALDRGALAVPGSATWPRLMLTPTATPVTALADAMAALTDADTDVLAASLRADPNGFVATARDLLVDRSDGAPVSGARLVVVVDQFEELFTLCEDEAERQTFVQVLAAATSSAQPVALVVLGLRADFYGHCAAYPDLVPALESGPLTVGAMSTAQLRRVITEPAAAVGLTLQPGLIELLLGDLGAEGDTGAGSYDPGALPLLSHVLRETWARRERRTLTVTGYAEAGGIREAIATTAERAYDLFDTTEQELARRLLLRLVRIVPDAQPTRRRADRARLVDEQPDPPSAEKVLAALADARLITVDEAIVEITHEKLLGAWDRLRTWVDADRAGLIVHYQLTEAAETWDREARDPDRLLRGAPLAIASDWAEKPANQANLIGLEKAFLVTSSRAAARRTRRLRQLIASLSVLLVLALVAGGVAVWQRQNALAQTHLALARSLVVGAAAASATDPGGSMLLAMEAFREAPTPESRSALFNAEARYFAGQLTIDPDSDILSAKSMLTGIAYSPDGRTVATADVTGGVVRLADPTTHAQVAALPGQDLYNGLAFSPDGRMLAAVGDRIELWDVASRRELDSLGGQYSVSFNSDGTLLATGGDDGAQLWNVASRQLIGSFADDRYVYAVAVSPDGHTLATGDSAGIARLWDVASHRQLASLKGHTKAIRSVKFSPDGHTLATGSDDGTARLWDVATRQLSATLAVSQDTAVKSVAFSPDGQSLATGAGDDRARVWDVASHQALASFTNNNATINSVAFSPDGLTLATAGEDGTAKLWSLNGPILLRHPDPTSTSLALSPKGDILATGGDHNLWLWSTITRRQLAVLPAGDIVSQLAFSPDGHLLAAGAADGTVTLWDVAASRLITTITDATAGQLLSPGVAFSPDGQTLAYASSADVHLWNVSTGKPTATLSGNGPHTTITFSRDGRLIAAGGITRVGVELWDAASHQKVATLGGDDLDNASFGVAFSPDGKTVAVGGTDRTVKLFDVAGHQPQRTLTGYSDDVYGLSFSPDGTTLASSDGNGKIRLSDTATYETIATLDGPTKGVASVAFGPDGRTLATSGKPVLWDLDPKRTIAELCRIVAPVSPEKWARLLPDVPYNHDCS